MRVTSNFHFLPYTISIDEFVDIPMPEEVHHGNISVAFIGKLFNYIPAGKERTCVILRADDYSYDDIAWIMGITVKEVKTILAEVKKKLIKAGLDK